MGVEGRGKSIREGLLGEMTPEFQFERAMKRRWGRER